MSQHGVEILALVAVIITFITKMFELILIKCKLLKKKKKKKKKNKDHHHK